MITLAAGDASGGLAARLLEVLTFRAGFNTSVVLAGVALLGLAGGVTGAFAVLRKRAMMSDTLSHATLPGIVAAFLMGSGVVGEGKSLPILLLGAAISGVVAVLTVQGLRRYTRLSEDASMGVVLSVFFGLGVVLLTHTQRMGLPNQGGLNRFIFGQAAAMGWRDAVWIGVVAVASLASAGLLLKEFRLVCFDAELARVQGWPVGLIDLLMMGLITLVTVIGLYAVGLVLIVALLVIPPTTARLWTDRLGWMVAISGAVGVVSGALGVAVSRVAEGVPTGPVIVLVAGTCFALSLLVSPRRGALAGAIARVGLRLKMLIEHALRRAAEEREALGEGAAGGDGRGAVGAIGRAGPMVRWLLRARGLAGRSGEGWGLTEAGWRDAGRVLRNHRLWEQYLITYADVAASHVDHSADLVEHVLGPGIVGELEAALARRGIGAGVPASPHPIGGGAS